MATPVAVGVGVATFLFFPPILTLALSGAFAIGAYRLAKFYLQNRDSASRLRQSFFMDQAKDSTVWRSNPFEALWGSSFNLPNSIREAAIRDFCARHPSTTVTFGQVESLVEEVGDKGAMFEVDLPMFERGQQVGTLHCTGNTLNSKIRLHKVTTEGEAESDKQTIQVGKDHYRVRKG